MNKYNELKQEYTRVLRNVQKSLPEAALPEDFFRFYRSCILKIWNENRDYSPDYANLLSLLSGKEYSIDLVTTGMSLFSEQKETVTLPAFFDSLIKEDQEKGTQAVKQFLEEFNELMVASAIINGDFTREEAGALTDIMEALTQAAREAKVAVPAPADLFTRVTPRKDNSYFSKKITDVLTDPDPIAHTLRRVGSDLFGSAGLSNGWPLNGTPDPFENLGPVPGSPADPGAADPASEDVSPGTPAAGGLSNVTATEPEEEETLESLLEELDGLVGLEGVKKDVRSLMNFIKVTKIREERGMKVPAISCHLVFTGNPGTGKTTVARLVAKLYHRIGILPKGQLVETDRSALVAGYVGQTALKTQEVIQKAMGGVLFIDEAYALSSDANDSYGKEAIETVLKAMEDHRKELVVIVAGYTDLMYDFIHSNPGLSSRFSKYFEFPDYTGAELTEIFQLQCKKNGYRLSEEAETVLKGHFDALYLLRDEHFGNGRTARNIFEKAINAQANRLAGLEQDLSDTDLESLTVEDIQKAIGRETAAEAEEPVDDAASTSTADKEEED